MWRVIPFLMLPATAGADSLVATQVIKAQDLITADAIVVVDADIPGAVTELSAVLGLEARVAIYPGRAILHDQIGPAAMVERNQIVTLSYQVSGLVIRTDGRALARAGAGEMIEVMNLASKTKITGRVGLDGSVTVGPSPSP
jgi:flagella basal body P-ring formation protein FlgA